MKHDQAQSETTRWQPTTPIEKLSCLLAWPPYVNIEYTLAKGCLCGSCEVYRLSWEDDEDKPRSVEHDNLVTAIERTWEEIEDAKG